MIIVTVAIGGTYYALNSGDETVSTTVAVAGAPDFSSAAKVDPPEGHLIRRSLVFAEQAARLLGLDIERA